jgi:hypothetical protein
MKASPAASLSRLYSLSTFYLLQTPPSPQNLPCPQIPFLLYYIRSRYNHSGYITQDMHSESS